MLRQLFGISEQLPQMGKNRRPIYYYLDIIISVGQLRYLDNFNWIWICGMFFVCEG